MFTPPAALSRRSALAVTLAAVSLGAGASGSAHAAQASAGMSASSGTPMSMDASAGWSYHRRCWIRHGRRICRWS